jgi:hypothetical protein
MQIRPMRRQLQPTDLGSDQGVFVGLRGGQGAGSAQRDHIIIEHIQYMVDRRQSSPISARHSQQTTPDQFRQHQTNSDNTRPIQTTLHSQGCGLVIAHASLTWARDQRSLKASEIVTVERSLIE